MFQVSAVYYEASTQISFVLNFTSNSSRSYIYNSVLHLYAPRSHQASPLPALLLTKG